MRRLPSPVVVLLGVLPLLGWTIGLVEAIGARRAELVEARGAYELALSETKAALTAQLARAAYDATLVQNLNWHLAHSVRGALDGRLAPGAVEQLVVVDKACNELGRSSGPTPAAALPCPLPAATPGSQRSDGLWIKGPRGPALVAGIPLPGVDGGGGQMLGVVELGPTWLATHAGLSTTLDRLGLRLGDDGAVTILKAGVDQNGTPLASLTSDRLLDRLIAGRFGAWLGSGDVLLWPCLVAALAAAMLALARERAGAAARRRALRDFLDWARALTPSGTFVVPGKRDEDATGVLSEDLDHARKLVQHALNLKSEAVQGLAAKKQALETRLLAREDELQKHRQRLSELAELDSLAVQLQRTTAAFLERMDEFHEGAGELGALAAGPLTGEAEALGRHLARWQAGVLERGARKFLRGLSETPGDGAATALDDELAVLGAHAARIAGAAREAAGRTKALSEAAAFAARVAGLWQALALKTHEDQSCDSLLTALEDAQALLALEPGLAGVRFSPPPDDLGPDGLPELPKALWVSALFHVFLAVADVAQGGAARIATRLRQDGDKVIVVVQLAESPPTLARRGSQQAYHLEIARAMLAPFGVAVSALPVLDGPYPAALSWSATAPYRRAGGAGALAAEAR